MGMFSVIKTSSKILPLSYSFVDICLQDWSPSVSPSTPI